MQPPSVEWRRGTAPRCQRRTPSAGFLVLGRSSRRRRLTFLPDPAAFYRHNSWTTVTQLVALNTPPIANGLLYTYINDTLVMAHTGLVWRTDERVILSRVLFSTFFGGSSSSYFPPKSQTAYFKNFQVS